jgi:hypothetical protein
MVFENSQRREITEFMLLAWGRVCQKKEKKQTT